MRILDFILCDDIRREEGQKSSLMGIFGNGIGLTVPAGTPRPIAMRLGIFVRVMLDEEDLLPDRFQIQILNGEDELAKFEGQLSITEMPTIMAFPLVANRLPVPGDCQLTFSATFWSGDNVILEDSLPYPVDVTVSDAPVAAERQ